MSVVSEGVVSDVTFDGIVERLLNDLLRLGVERAATERGGRGS